MYFRGRVSTLYTVDLINEDALLKWSNSEKDGLDDQIEDINRASLAKLVE